jgi:hypothetical protein
MFVVIINLILIFTFERPVKNNISYIDFAPLEIPIIGLAADTEMVLQVLGIL